MTLGAHEGCKVCGAADTVKSHIFPRALMHELRGKDPALIEIRENSDQVALRQSGLWDRFLLCAKHEAATAPLDDYAVKIWRKYQQQPRYGSKSVIEVVNEKPRQLILFAYAVLWRWRHSKYGTARKCDFGPYDSILREAVFETGQATLPVMIFEGDLRLEHEKAALCVAPFRTRLNETRGWLFRIGVLDVFTFLDQRPVPSILRPFLANEAATLPIFKTDPLQAADARGLSSLLAKAAR